VTSTVPDIVIGDNAILAAVRIASGDPEMDVHAVDDAEVDAAFAMSSAVGPYLIRDWVRCVLARYPHVLPGQLAELADGLLPEETT